MYVFFGLQQMKYEVQGCSYVCCTVTSPTAPFPIFFFLIASIVNNAKNINRLNIMKERSTERAHHMQCDEERTQRKNEWKWKKVFNCHNWMGPLNGIRFGGFRYRINVFLTRIFSHGPFFSILRNIFFTNEILNTFISTCTFWFHDVSTRLIANCAVWMTANASEQWRRENLREQTHSEMKFQLIIKCIVCKHLNI